MRTTYTREPGDDDPSSQAQWDEDRKNQGWAAPEIWNLGEGLAAWLGSALIEFRSVDEPISGRRDGYWDELTRHAEALVAFGDFYDEARIFRLMGAIGFDAVHEMIVERREAAQNALRWVADNLDALRS